MATTTDPTHMDSISEDTVAFVKTTIADFCRARDLMVMPWAHGVNPVDQLEGVCILRERCNLEYPLLSHGSHFHSGARITVRTYAKGVHLLLEPTTEGRPAP